MELLYIFTTSFIVAFSGAMMPGPLLAVTITESARRGFAAGPLLVLGHAVLEGGLVAALSAGLAAVLARPAVAMVIALVGGLFLVWMGWSMARDAYFGKVELAEAGWGKEDLQYGGQDSSSVKGETGGVVALPPLRPGQESSNAKGEKGSRTPMHPVLAGVLVSLSNPYWSIWWATVGLGYLTMSLKYGTTGVVIFFSGHILADLAWYCLVAAGVVGSKRFLTPRVYRGIIIACGLFLVLLGGSFVYYGMTV